MCLAQLHHIANMCAKIFFKCLTHMEVVQSAKFSQCFCHEMLLPWQCTFRQCQKMCLAHLHLTANMWAKFKTNAFKNKEVVQSAMFPPIFCHNILLPWQYTFCNIVKKCVLPISIPRQKFVPNFMRTV